MAKITLKDCQIYLGGYNLTGDSNNASIDAGKDEVENTAFGSTTRTYQADGLRTVGAAAEGHANYGGSEAGINDMLASTIPASFIPQGNTEGNIAYFFNSNTGTFSPLGGSVGDIAPYTLDLMSANRLVRGNLLASVSNATTSGATTEQELGTVSATQSVYAALHVFSLAGSSPTLDVVIQSDATGFASPADQITFSQVSGDGSVGYEYATTAGAITDGFWRVSYTLGGTVTDCDFAVVIGIQNT